MTQATGATAVGAETEHAALVAEIAAKAAKPKAADAAEVVSVAALGSRGHMYSRSSRDCSRWAGVVSTREGAANR